MNTSHGLITLIPTSSRRRKIGPSMKHFEDLLRDSPRKTRPSRTIELTLEQLELLLKEVKFWKDMHDHQVAVKRRMHVMLDKLIKEKNRYDG